jgi:GGDEF domain-containing protein
VILAVVVHDLEPALRCAIVRPGDVVAHHSDPLAVGRPARGGRLARHDGEYGTMNVTISLGATTSCGPSPQADLLVRLADEALYRAKTGGRDRVELAVSPEILMPELS